MDSDEHHEHFGLPDRLATSFHQKVVVVRPDAPLAYVAADWRSALVVVDSGQVEVVDVAGRRAVFGPGDVLTFHGLALRTLHARGGRPAVLLAVTRKAG